MSDRSLGVVMNGVTGRMGHNQHLVRSVLAIRAQGGVLLSDGTRVQIEPVLVGRNERKLQELAKTTESRGGRPTSQRRSRSPTSTSTSTRS